MNNEQIRKQHPEALFQSRKYNFRLWLRELGRRLWIQLLNEHLIFTEKKLVFTF